MSPEDRAQYGAAVAKDAAFDAVRSLWIRRSAENWTRKQIAESIGVDEGWLSKQFQGPRNWTMETFGALVMGLNGNIEIIVRAMEDITSSQYSNYDAYAEMDDLQPKGLRPPGSGTTPAKIDEQKYEPV
jgi:hypothetical protein